jgi:hypothetical protein
MINMSWRDIVKAPTSNSRDKDGSWNHYRGKRSTSYMHDNIMASIVKELNLPEGNYYENWDDFDLDISSTVEYNTVTLTVKPKGVITIYREDEELVHTIKEENIKLEGSIEIDFNKKFEIDFEFEEFADGVLYLTVGEA